MPFTANDLLNAVGDALALPETCQRINEMVGDEQYSAADIAELILLDPGLTTRLLKIANSPFFGFPSHIDSVPKAITIIGTEELRQLVLATSAVDMFSTLPNELVSMETFWRHSLRCAVIARTIAAFLKEPEVEHYFTAGLLHDIGYLVIYRELPELAEKTQDHCAQNRGIVYIVEQEIIGFDHAEVGAELLRRWKLPPAQVEAVACHHTPSLARQFPRQAAIIHIANYLANTMLSNLSPSLEPTEALDMQALEWIGLSPDDLQILLRKAEQQFHDTLNILVYDQVA
jgi:putative nucleotidyltransferase with HDIG domain